MKRISNNGLLFIVTLYWSFNSGDCNCESTPNETYRLDNNGCMIQSICYGYNIFDTRNFNDCNQYYNKYSVTFIDVCKMWDIDEIEIVLEGQTNRVKYMFIENGDCKFFPHIRNSEALIDLNLHGNKLQAITSNINQDFPSLEVLDVSNNVISEINTYVSVHYPNLLKLNVSFNNISTVHALGNLEKLKILDLSSNILEELNMLSFYDLNNLEDLRLSNNRLTQINYVFPNLRKLRELHLDFNQITDIKKECFENLHNLEMLSLSNNRITEISNVFSSLTQLIEIKLDFNQITGIQGDCFENQANLKVILLNSNNITKVEWVFLKNKPMLAKFDISYNNISILDKKSFKDNIVLEYVDLSHNKLTKLYPNTFLNKNLSFFSIEDNLLEGRLERGMFEGMKLMGELDLSYQTIDKVADYAFNGLKNLLTLLLNNNKIKTLQTKAFRSLTSLEVLDLSNNMLLNIDYEKNDLVKLKNLNLRNNFIDHLTASSFLENESLFFLDISHNNITRLEKDTFRFLREAENIELSYNPLAGAIDVGTFEGLESLPNLDLSHTSINVIVNESFVGLLQLVKLNISHADVHEVQYNAFCGLSELESMDLSFNKMTVFNLNFSCVGNIKFLSLKENLLTTLGPIFVKNMIELDLSFNKLIIINDNILEKLEGLSILNLAYNNNLTFNFNFIKHMKKLSSLLLGGLTLEVSNSKNENLKAVKKLDLRDSNIVDINKFQLDVFADCEELDLSGNQIPFVKYGMISKNTRIRIINMSFNEISFIHPGSFIHNNEIEVLNVAHNKIFELEYGIFQGMERLNYLDISFNNIKTLHRGVFDETSTLTTLIADNNDIKTIEYNEFSEARLLETLSIGDNPILCKTLDQFKKFNNRIYLTSLVHENYKSNYHGITCYSSGNNINSNNNDPNSIDGNILYNNNTFERQEQLLEDIKGLIKLVAIQDNNQNNNKNDNSNASIIWSTLAQDIHSYFNKTDDINAKLLAKIDSDSKTSESLYKIIRNFNFTLASLLLGRDGLPSKNQSSDSMLNYLLQDLKDKIDNFDKRLNEIEKDKIHSTENETGTDKLVKISNDVSENSPLVYEKPVKLDAKAFVFQDICLGFIAIVILCLVLHKAYKSDIFVPVRRSMSRRRINDSIETATL